jgi:glycosyltransferase involved in cell wall biosynthesis
VVWGNHPSPTADLGAVYALATRRPWVATYHADVGSDRWWKRRYLAWEMRLLRKARLVLVTSDRYRDRLVARGVPRDRIVSVAPGPYIGDGSLPIVPPGTTAAGADAPFLFVGALDAAHAYKRLDQLLAAVAELARTGAPVALEVVGDGNRRAEFERQASELGVADRVRFLGRLDDRELAVRFARARALVVASPAETEGFGSVAVEAIQYGCPVIVSSRVAVADLLGPAGAAELFDPDRPGALAEAMRVLVTEPDRRSRLSNGARALAPSLGWPSALPRITEPVRRLLPGAPRSMSPR